MAFFEKHGVAEKEFIWYEPLKNFSFPLHFHRAYELIFINDGQLSVTINQKEFLLQKNDLAFIFTNQMHEFKTIESSEITILLFSPELIGDFYMNYKGYIPENNILRLERELDLNGLSSIYSQKSFLYSICSDLINQTKFVPIKQTPQTKVLYKILLYVEQNYSSDCSLKAVAKHLQYDYPYLSKLFVKLMDMTFTDYLNHYRISQACYLLENDHLQVGEVALRCGYNNLRSFHRNFRKLTGNSPKKYRGLD
jgi:AraC-type DNA-binding domain-containing proteins